MIEAAWRRVPGASAPADVPFWGLGGALVVHVARGFGSRRWQERGRVAVAAIEAYNQQAWQERPEDPGPKTRSAWLAHDPLGVLGTLRSVLRHDEPLLRRVCARVVGAPGFGDHTLPEPVLFLRAAVAAGVLAGAVPDEIHALLDRFATGLGMSLCDPTEGWDGALLAIGLAPGVSPELVIADALELLPDGDAKEQLSALNLAGVRRTLPSWIPHHPPVPSPRPAPPWPIEIAQWSQPLEEQLLRGATGPSLALNAAARRVRSAGGKRARACVTLGSALACGADPSLALDAAARIEWLHQVSLVLDDILDDAPLRRGTPPLHKLTSTPFTLGFSAWALYHTIFADPLPETAQRRLVQTGIAIAEGQRTELVRTGDLALTDRELYRIIGEKTARLFSCAAALGGIAVNAPARHIDALARYGQEAGLAFQILDDLLDYVGDEGVLGKTPGTDLRAAKVTLPLVLLREASDAAGRARLAHTLAHPDPESFAALREAMATLGIPEACSQRAQTHCDRALDAISGLPSSAGVQVLSRLASDFVSRSA